MSRAYSLRALSRARIDVSQLGCVMLDVTLPALPIPPEWGYRTSNPSHWWVDGVQTRGHATLLYGLLPGLVGREDVDEVLEGWAPEPLPMQGLDVFPSPFSAEPYSCIVARVDSPSLTDAHQRLSLLPHIDTHPEYKAHVTLAYVHPERERNTLEVLNDTPLMFHPLGINYGDQLH